LQRPQTIRRSEGATAGGVSGADAGGENGGTGTGNETGDTGTGDGAKGVGAGGETRGTVAGGEIDRAACGMQEVRALGCAGINHFETTKRTVVYGRHGRSVSTTLPDVGST
jgi:hypothetical protein